MSEETTLEPEGYTVTFVDGESVGLVVDAIKAEGGMISFFEHGRVVAMYPVSSIASVLHYVLEHDLKCRKAALQEQAEARMKAR